MLTLSQPSTYVLRLSMWQTGQWIVLPVFNFASAGDEQPFALVLNAFVSRVFATALDQIARDASFLRLLSLYSQC